MGNGASIQAAAALTHEEAVEKLLIAYAADPRKWESIIEEVRKRHSENFIALQGLQNEQKPSKVGKSKKSAAGNSAGTTVAPLAEEDRSFRVEDMSIKTFSSDIAEELTKLRKKPSDYVITLQRHLQSFTDEFIYTNKDGVFIRTKEGKAAVKEAINVLQSTNPLCAIKPSPLLEKAARCHAMDIFDHSLVGHDGSDGSTSRTRIEKYAMWSGSIGECIDFGSNTPTEIVVSLLVDDGVESRGHRKNLLDPNFKLVGAVLGPHKIYSCACVMDFAGAVIDINDTLQSDCVLSIAAKGTIDEDFQQAINSIPGANIEQLLSTVKKELAEGCSVKLEFLPSKSKAIFTFSQVVEDGKGGSVNRKKTLESSWMIN